MRVGAYVDALNLYYGARRLCGRGKPGWRWLDVRALIESSIPRRWGRQGAELSRIVYCTAHVTGDRDPSSATDQETYLRALDATRSVDEIVYGKFVSRPKVVPLTPLDGDSSTGSRIVLRNWPLKLLDAENHKRINEVDALGFVRKREEKATDVNLATYLLLDAFHGEIDAAIPACRCLRSRGSSGTRASL